MVGPVFERPTAAAIEQLARASTATLQTILKRMEVRRIWMPLYPLQRGVVHDSVI